MGKTDTTDNLELDPITDETGAVVEADDAISRAMAPHKVEFKHDGLKYMAWIRKTQVSTRLLNRVSAIQSKIALSCGFKPGEEVQNDDPRTGRFMELLMENEVMEVAKIDIAIAATIMQDSKPVTNIPQFKEAKNFDRNAVLDAGALGGAYVSAVEAVMRPTLEEEPEAGPEAAPKTKTASTTKP